MRRHVLIKLGESILEAEEFTNVTDSSIVLIVLIIFSQGVACQCDFETNGKVCGKGIYHTYHQGQALFKSGLEGAVC